VHVSTAADDLIPDLPPMPPTGGLEEEALGPDDAGGNDDLSEAPAGPGIDAYGVVDIGSLEDMVDDLDDEPTWTDEGGVDGLVSLDALVEDDEPEDGHTRDNEAADEGDLGSDAFEMAELPSLLDDGGEGPDDADLLLPLGSDADEDGATLPPLDADGLLHADDDEVDIGLDGELDLPP
jgi:hypothetical protein